MTNLIQTNKKILLIVFIAMLFTFNLKVTAQSKNTLEYKTSIIDQNQKPMPDGNYNFRFALYNVQNGGSALWSEDWFGVPVRRAAISVSLGSFISFPTNLFKNTSLYLQVCMDANLAGGDGGGECSGSFEENFKPRKVMSAAPWAFNASSLGPVTIATGETAYNVNTFGSDGTLLNLNFNDNQRFSVDSNGNVGLINGTKSFTFSPDAEQIKLTEGTDILFGDNISLRNSSAANTSGASIIGVSTAGLQNLVGADLQTVLNNIDPLLRWKANGSSVFYNGGNVGIGTDSPAFALDVVGTGEFTNGIIIGNNTNNVAGAIRFNGVNFEGYDGVTWIPFSAGAGATTDNGAGLTYVTNLTNAFGIGGNTAGTSPYVFNPATGALIRRNTTIRNDPAAPSTNILTLDSTGGNAKTGGNFDSLLVSSAYTPTGGAGTEAYNGIEVTSTVNAGDGTDISRQRGLVSTVVNNSSGSINGIFNLSSSTTNNGLFTNLTGYSNTLTNNSSGTQILDINNFSTNNGNLAGTFRGTNSVVTNNGNVGADISGSSSFGTNSVTGTTGQLAGTYSQITNNGTGDFAYTNRLVGDNNGNLTNSLYGLLSDLNNAGTTPLIYGMKSAATNTGSGVVSSDVFGIHNDTSNAGTINGNLRGIFNSVANGGTVLGDTTGLYSTDGITTVILNLNGTLAIDASGGAVRFSNEAIIGNSLNDTAGALRWTGADFEGFDGGSWVSLTAGGGGASQWNDNGSDIYFDTGFVGISTNAPAVDLDVNGPTRISGGLGIGQLPDGAYPLEVAGAAQFANEIVIGNNTSDAAGGIRFNGVNFEGYNGTTWNSLGGGTPSQWLDNGADIYFDAGNVGVGAAAAGPYTFDVTGTSQFSSDVTIYGNVGLGMSPTLDRFSVSGTAFFSSDITMNSGFLTVNGDILASGTSTFNGQVNINNSNLIVTNGAICADGGTGCPALTPGQIYGDLAYVEFDVAENILAKSDVEAGDIVSAMEGQSEVVRKSSTANESILGVISTNPGSLGGFTLKPRDGFKVLPFVLSGRVPVKVSTENGAINVGDPIASSSIPGVGMKATQSKTKILGYAMQAYNSNGVAKIIVIFQPGYLP